jgi:gamma-glutamyltranspeptidase/glutathione hydrolase
LTVVDGDGNAVSFINSLFNGFGTGLMSDTTGVMFQNRGALFVIDETHPGRIGPGRRPMHTIMPGMATRNGRTEMSFGVMGGHYQPFGHTHLLGNVIDFGLDVQQALELPRVFHYDGVLSVETGIPDATADQLRALGHEVENAPIAFGGGQAIWIDHDRGVLVGGSDPRKDGCALGY